MNVERGRILKIVYSTIKAINEEKESEDDRLELKEETRLFGRKSKLDSFGLVNLIVDVEQRLADELGVEVVLANEKAMSQARSPFRDVQSLVDYICSLEV